MGPRAAHPVSFDFRLSIADWILLCRDRDRESTIEDPIMVFAVQCPNPDCRKYMLVEEHDRDKVVPCLLCKTAIKVAAAPPATSSSKKTPPPRR
jgi:hypothetical protein